MKIERISKPLPRVQLTNFVYRVFLPLDQRGSVLSFISSMDVTVLLNSE